MDSNNVLGTTIKTSSILNSLKILIVLILLNGSTLAVNRRMMHDLSEERQMYTADELIKEIIQLILNNDTVSAVKLLESSTIDNNKYLIANDKCETSTASRFESLIEFADMESNRTMASIIYVSLTRHLLNTKLNNKYLIELKELIKNKVINNADVDFRIKDDAMDILRSLNSYMKRYSLDFLRSLLIDKDIIDIEEGFDVINSNYQLDDDNQHDDQHESIYEDFLIEVRMRGEQLYKETFDNLYKLVTIYGSSYQELQLHFIKILIIKNFYNINLNPLLNLCMEYLSLENLYKNKVPAKGILQVRSMFKLILPVSIHSIYFTESQCIWNLALNEYVAAGQRDISERLYVFTIPANSNDGYIRWKFEFQGGRLKILNLHFNKYLVPPTERMSDGRHIAKMSDDPTLSQWELKIIGDFVLIEATRSNHFLFGSLIIDEDKESGWRGRHVFTPGPCDFDCPNKDCLWVIEDCNHFPKWQCPNMCTNKHPIYSNKTQYDQDEDFTGYDFVECSVTEPVDRKELEL